MPDEPDLLSSLRTYLADEGLVRVPTDSGSEPPMWLEPRDGVPAPGEGNKVSERGDTLVIGAFDVGGIPPRPYESFKRTDFIDIWMRSTTAKVARDFEVDLRAALADKRNWDMAGLTVIESLIFRDKQRLGSSPQAFDFVTEYSFERYSP